MFQGTKSFPVAATAGGSASLNERSRISHEVKRLYQDEGAARILNEMGRRGTKRRSTFNQTNQHHQASQAVVVLVSKPKPRPKRLPRMLSGTDPRGTNRRSTNRNTSPSVALSTAAALPSKPKPSPKRPSKPKLFTDQQPKETKPKKMATGSKASNKESKAAESLDLKCGTCGKVLKTSSSYRQHLLVHQPGSIKCDVCGKCILIITIIIQN